MRGEEDGEHGHEPEGEGEIEVLGVGEAANESKDEESDCESFEVGRLRATNLVEEEQVERDGEKGPDCSEGEKLLEEFVVGLLGFKCAEGWDDEAIRVEAVSRTGFLMAYSRVTAQIRVRPVRVSGPMPWL